MLSFSQTFKKNFMCNKTFSKFKISKTYSSQICFLMILFFSLTIKAQKVYKVPYENQADVKVCVVEYSNNADLRVFKVEYENQTGNNDGKWFFTEYGNQADKKIFFTEYTNQADIKICYVEYSNQAGWNDTSKKKLFD